MTTSRHFRGVCLDELLYRIDFCVDNHGKCHVYLHDSHWVIGAEQRNDIADDKVVDITRTSHAGPGRRHELAILLMKTAYHELLP